jgi:hypothetical protein
VENRYDRLDGLITNLSIEVKMTSTIAATFAGELEIQVTTLIEDAPDDRRTIQEIARLAPLLAQLALTRLHHADYYVIQDPEGGFLRLTLAHRTQPNVEKTVIAAFSTLEDAALEIQDTANLSCVGIKIPVLELLFRFWALQWGDALIFYSTAGDRTQGQEISHEALTKLLQKGPIAPKKSVRSVPKGFGKVV